MQDTAKERQACSELGNLSNARSSLTMRWSIGALMLVKVHEAAKVLDMNMTLSIQFVQADQLPKANHGETEQRVVRRLRIYLRRVTSRTSGPRGIHWGYTDDCAPHYTP